MEFKYKDTSQLDDRIIIEAAEKLQPYVRTLRAVVNQGDYSAPESSLNLPSDASILKDVTMLVKKMVTKRLKYVVVVGIGGSNLGTKAIYDALNGYTDPLEPSRFPRMIFAETVDAEYLSKLNVLLRKTVKAPVEVLVVVISKSGGTTETMANADVIMAALEKRWPRKAAERIVVITDRGSKLWQLAETRQLEHLAIPDSVGGRYSVFSSVGLFPLAAAGISITELLSGAKEMREHCLNNGPINQSNRVLSREPSNYTSALENNPALASAITLFLNHSRGFTINDTFLFHPELESLGKWYRQLMGESIGKEYDRESKIVHTGITPTVSIGSTDLHSMGQLYLGGPRDKFTTFVTTAKSSTVISERHSPTVPANGYFSQLIPGLQKKSLPAIMDAILQGVIIAYGKQRFPYTQVILDDLSPRSLGEFLQFKMVEMMYLGQLMNVNPFDQPNVELYKVETRRILKRSSEIKD